MIKYFIDNFNWNLAEIQGSHFSERARTYDLIEHISVASMAGEYCLAFVIYYACSVCRSVAGRKLLGNWLE